MASPNPGRKSRSKNRRHARTARRMVRPISGARRARARSSNPHEGSSLDDFLRSEGIYEEVTAAAIKETIAQQIARAMKRLGLTKTEMAERMGTSRAALDRLLDPDNESVTLATLLRAAEALGAKLVVGLRTP